MSSGISAREFVANVMRIKPEEIPEDASIENFEDWDSLTHGEVIMALEDELGRELGADEIASIESLADIERILNG